MNFFIIPSSVILVNRLRFYPLDYHTWKDDSFLKKTEELHFFCLAGDKAGAIAHAAARPTADPAVP